MLLYFRCKNFFSFAEQAGVSFEVGKKPALTGFDHFISDKRLNKVLAVIGANGSGKTNFLKPLSFICWFVAGSFRQMEPDEAMPWKSHLLFETEPCEFNVGFVCDDVEYRYELVITQGKVAKEALYRKTSRSFSYVFVLIRDVVSGVVQFKQKGFGLKSLSVFEERGNVSVVSFAKQFGNSVAVLLSQYFMDWSSNLSFSGRQNFEYQQVHDVAKFYQQSPEYLERVSQILCEFDLGIEHVEIREVEMIGTDKKAVMVPVPMAKHCSESGDFSLSLLEESSGTQSAFVLLRRILPVLKCGGVAIIDEIDNDLHPHMLSRILDWFRDPILNPNNAQLIFTCHSPEVLNLLMKHQVYLVEKRQQQSEAWRLDDVEGLRADDNLYAKYMAGALSAVPDFG